MLGPLLRGLIEVAVVLLFAVFLHNRFDREGSQHPRGPVNPF
jgi:hypothetical protein